jgi:hypothetical protein
MYNQLFIIGFSIAIYIYHTSNKKGEYEYYINDWTEDDMGNFNMYTPNYFFSQINSKYDNVYMLIDNNLKSSWERNTDWAKIYTNVNTSYKDDGIELAIKNYFGNTKYIINLKYGYMTLYVNKYLIGYISTDDCTANNCYIYKGDKECIANNCYIHKGEGCEENDCYSSNHSNAIVHITSQGVNEVGLTRKYFKIHSKMHLDSQFIYGIIKVLKQYASKN